MNELFIIGMAQRLKPEVRNQIVEAATRVFASRGYEAATVSDIAAQAEISTGNVYRYFSSKRRLFDAVMPDELPVRYLELVTARVAALTSDGGLTQLDADAEQRAEELLDFWIDHRLQLVVLMARSAGTQHEGFSEQFVDELVRLMVLKLRADLPNLRVSKLIRFELDNAARHSLRSIVAILETFETRKQIRAAIAGFWSFQLAGLDGLTKWIGSNG